MISQGSINRIISLLRNSGQQIGTTSDVAFAHSANANTQKTITITKPDNVSTEYEIVVNNPSTITDLTVKFFNVETEGDAFITSVVIPKSQAVSGTTINTYAVFVHGLFCGTNVKIVVSNNTALGATEGFTGKVKLREVR